MFVTQKCVLGILTLPRVMNLVTIRIVVCVVTQIDREPIP